MSLDALRWALAQDDVRSAPQRAVLVSYANHCPRGQAVAFPSLKCLQAETKHDRKTIISARQQLSELRLMRDTGRRVGRTGRVPVYELDLRNERKNGTIEKVEIRHHSGGETVPLFPGNSPGTGTLNGPKNGTRNRGLNRALTGSTAPDGANPAREFVFREGLALLTAAGKAEAGARSFLGKLCGTHGDARVADALHAAIAKQPVEPLSWIRSALQGPARRKAADIDLHRVDYTVGLPGSDQ